MPSPKTDDVAPPPITDRAFEREIIAMIYRPRFRSFCRSLANRLTTDADTDDFVQDVARRAWGARGSYKPGSNAKAWLHVIARNVAFTAASKRQREQRNVAAAVHDPEFGAAHLTYRTPGLPNGVMIDTGASVEEQLDTAAEWREVSANLDSMRPEHSAALADQYFHGIDWKESGQKHGCSHCTILAWRSRGIRQLRDCA